MWQAERARGWGRKQEFGRSERIRTFDPRLPKAVLYQTELHSDDPWQGACQGGAIVIKFPRQGIYIRSITMATTVRITVTSVSISIM